MECLTPSDNTQPLTHFQYIVVDPPGPPDSPKDGLAAFFSVIGPPLLPPRAPPAPCSRAAPNAPCPLPACAPLPLLPWPPPAWAPLPRPPVFRSHESPPQPSSSSSLQQGNGRTVQSGWGDAASGASRSELAAKLRSYLHLGVTSLPARGRGPAAPGPLVHQRLSRQQPVLHLQQPTLNLPGSFLNMCTPR